jgi:hypothetical protein
MEVNLTDITFLSSIHGRDRRKLRNIGIKDLKSAVKYGKKEPQTFEYETDRYFKKQRQYKKVFKHRGCSLRLYKSMSYNHTTVVRNKYTFGDYVYIEEDGQEITSWIEPIEIPKVDSTMTDIKTHKAMHY